MSPTPESEAAASAADRRVLEALRSAGAPDGFLPFDRFLEIALYAPEVGYYARRGLRLGREGDFYTAAHVHPIFGRTVARRIRAEYERLGRPSRFRIVEVGPGDGTLAAGVIETLASSGDWPEGTPYHLVDISGPLRDSATGRLDGLRKHPFDLHLGSSVGGDGPFTGVVIANELLDALPFRRLVRRGNGWAELGTHVGPEGIRWEEREMVRPMPEPSLPAAAEGTVLECSERAEAWIREVADSLVGGTAILLDYGDEEPELLARGPHGTLASVRSHRAQRDPLADPGRSDLSAFVNFTRIRAAARRAGLRVLAYRGQAEALGSWGFEAVRDEALAGAASAEDQVRVRLAAKNLLFGFGNFRVLELAPPGAPSAT